MAHLFPFVNVLPLTTNRNAAWDTWFQDILSKLARYSIDEFLTSVCLFFSSDKGSNAVRRFSLFLTIIAIYGF